MSSILNQRDIELVEICKREGIAPFEGDLPNWKLAGQFVGRSANAVGKQYRRLMKRVEKAGTTLEIELIRADNGYSEKEQDFLNDRSMDVWYEADEPSDLQLDVNTDSVQETLIEQVYQTSGVDRDRYEIKIKKMWGNAQTPQVSYDIIPKPLPSNYEEIFKSLSELDFKFNIPEHDGSGNHSVIISAYDLHISKRDINGAGHKETIEKYKIAITKLVSKLQHYDIQEVLYILGNDMIHTDGVRAETTRQTSQDVSTGWKHAFDLAVETAIWTVNALSQIGRVKVINVLGNHGMSMEYALGRVVKHAFGDKIDFDSGYNTRFYHQYHSHGWVFTHGDKERKNSMMQLFITESPNIFVNTNQRCAFTGHYHGLKTTVKEEYGFMERVLPSLNANVDSFHDGAGYIGNQPMAIAHLYDRESQVADFYAYG